MTLLAGCAGENDGDLESRLTARIEESEAEVVGLYFKNLATGDSLLINAGVRMHAASMMKVPVMVRLYRMSEAGGLDLDAPIPVRNEFTSIYDDSAYSLAPDDDSDSTLYAMVGSEVTARELIDLMIARSSNLATNTLVEIAGPDSIVTMLAAFGAQGMKVVRGVEDIPAYRAGMNNMTSARGLLELYSALGHGDAASIASTREMMDILLRQEFNDAIPAGLPEGVPVAHKTGWITAVDHDAGIVLPQGGAAYVLVVLTSGVADETITRRATADVSRLIWEMRMER